jgi:mono/diheme cytochrome c family protein
MAAIVAMLITGVVTIPEAGGQKTGVPTTPSVTDSMYGPDLYKMYCATCHGRDGKGAGPVAPALKVAPPDLTVLSRREHGVFPATKVETIITGDTAVAAHGSKDMPTWGPIFRALDPSDARVTRRIRSLVAHVESIQQK